MSETYTEINYLDRLKKEAINLRATDFVRINSNSESRVSARSAQKTRLPNFGTSLKDFKQKNHFGNQSAFSYRPPKLGSLSHRESVPTNYLERNTTMSMIPNKIYRLDTEDPQENNPTLENTVKLDSLSATGYFDDGCTDLIDDHDSGAKRFNGNKTDKFNRKLLKKNRNFVTDLTAKKFGTAKDFGVRERERERGGGGGRDRSPTTQRKYQPAARIIAEQSKHLLRQSEEVNKVGGGRGELEDFEENDGEGHGEVIMNVLAESNVDDPENVIRVPSNDRVSYYSKYSGLEYGIRKSVRRQCADGGNLGNQLGKSIDKGSQTGKVASIDALVPELLEESGKKKKRRGTAEFGTEEMEQILSGKLQEQALQPNTKPFIETFHTTDAFNPNDSLPPTKPTEIDPNLLQSQEHGGMSYINLHDSIYTRPISSQKPNHYKNLNNDYFDRNLSSEVMTETQSPLLQSDRLKILENCQTISSQNPSCVYQQRQGSLIPAVEINFDGKSTPMRPSKSDELFSRDVSNNVSATYSKVKSSIDNSLSIGES